jgi:hypothetical protein
MTSARTRLLFVCEYTLLRFEHARSEYEGAKTFRKQYQTGRTVEVTISYGDGTILARIDDVELEPEFVEELGRLGFTQRDEMTAECAQAIDEPLTEIRTFVRHVLTLIKYHLRHFDLREELFSIKSERWGTEMNDLRDFPHKYSLSHQDFSNRPLNNQSQNDIQNSLSANIHPLLAMRHLHRAKHERLPHHKWIDATIAAELAVKEVLCRARPDLELILLEVPSPPFAKMYGPILEKYLGAESPYRKALIKGQETRNKLVHRPASEKIDHQAANDYVDVVEASIFHLLSLLYPEDQLIKQARILLGRYDP